MRSIQYIIITVCALILFGTVLYFGIRDESDQLKAKTKDDLQILPNSKEPLVKEEEKIPTVKPEKEISHLKEGIVEIIKAPEEIISKPSPNEAIQYTDNEDAIVTSAGSILLKSVLKGMVCVMGEVSPLSISCCGALALSEDSADDKQACVLMDSYKPFGADDFMYRLRFIVGKDLVIYKEVSGFPQPDSKCYPLTNISEKQVCASINFVLPDENFSDVTGYNTCTFMHFGYGPKQPKQDGPKQDATKDKDNTKDDNQILGYAEDVNCDTDKETIIKKSLGSPFSVVLRLKIDSQNLDLTADKNEGSESEGDRVLDGDKWLLSQHQNDEESNTDSETVSSTVDSAGNMQLSNSVNPTDVPNPSSSEEEGSTTSSSSSSDDEYDAVPVQNVGFTSIFGRILDFIRNHILGIFLTQESGK